MFNTGMFVLQPHHQPLMRAVYDSYEENEYTSKEMVPLSYHVLKNGRDEGVDPRFNKILDTEITHHYPFLTVDGVEVTVKTLAQIVNTIFSNAYFLHFIKGKTRNFISLLVQGDFGLAKRLLYVRDNYPEQPFVIGKNQVELSL